MRRHSRELRGDSDFEALISIAVDKTRHTKERRKAILALGELGDPRAVELLGPLLRQPKVVAAAAEALVRIGDPRAVRYFGYLTRSQNRFNEDIGKARMAQLHQSDPEGFMAALAELKQRVNAEKAEFQARWLTPVETWRDCPLCREQFTAQAESVVYCEPCGHYFTDANVQPEVSRRDVDYGALRGSQPLPNPPTVTHYGERPRPPWVTAMAWRLEDAKGHFDKGEVVALDRYLMDIVD